MEIELQSVQYELVPTRQKFSQQALIDDCHTQLVTNMRFLLHIQKIFSLPDIHSAKISSFVTLHPGRVAIHWISVESQCVPSFYTTPTLDENGQINLDSNFHLSKQCHFEFKIDLEF